MTAFPFTSMGALAPAWRRLALRNALAPPLSLSRAQVSTRSTALTADGATWTEYAADLARFNGSERRLLLGGQRTNGIRNPRAEGAATGVIGSGGALPTNWALTTGGMTTEILAIGTSNGISTVTLRVSGTLTATAYQLQLEAASIIVAAPSQTWTLSTFLRRDAAPAPFTNTRLRIGGKNSGGGTITGNTFDTIVTPSSVLSRLAATATLTSDAAIARVHPVIALSGTISSTYDETITIGWPQMEEGGFASSPILPATGSPAASTRGADLVSASLAALGIAGPCTILWSGMVPQNAPSTGEQMLCQIDDGTDNNRYRLRNASGGAFILAGRITGGTAVNAVTLGSMMAGTAFRAGVTIDATGRIAACINGAAVQAATGGPTSGLTTLRIGNNAGNTAAMFGEVADLCLLPFAVPDSALPGLLNTLPP